MSQFLNKKLLLKMLEKAKEFNAPILEVQNFLKRDPFKTLIFTVLSARTKDSTTLKITKKLFKKFKNPLSLSKANISELKRILFGIGFYKNKAKYIKNISKILVKKYNGKVPNDFNALISLPGVGRKTANIVLSTAFNDKRIGVDTHVHRISNRLGLVNTTKRETTEKELEKIFNKELWPLINLTLVAYGQTICVPKKPKCNICIIKERCKFYIENLRGKN